MVDEADLPPFDRDAASFTYDRWHGWWHLARTGSRGLTTLQCRHVSIEETRIAFSFPGKSGQRQSIVVEDPDLLLSIAALAAAGKAMLKAKAASAQIRNMAASRGMKLR